MIVSSPTLKTLDLNKLHTIEIGDVLFQVKELCLLDTINWEPITKKKNSLTVNEQNTLYAKQNCCKLLKSIRYCGSVCLLLFIFYFLLLYNITSFLIIIQPKKATNATVYAMVAGRLASVLVNSAKSTN
jgi:hypothetical protein